MNKKKVDIVIVGTGASGLFAALHLPQDKQILMITKAVFVYSMMLMIMTVLWKIR